MKKILFILLVFCWFFSFSQKTLQGQIVDFDTTVPIAFAKILYGEKTIISDWEGKFEIEIKNDKKPILFSYKGYHNNNYYIAENVTYLLIKMINDNSQKTAEIYSENVVNAIVKKVIENKSKNNPDKAFKSYEYKNYEDVLVTANPKFISNKIDTITKKTLFGTKIKLDSTNYKFKKLVENQHLYQTEKVNLIQHNNNDTKETILATRMAGFKKPLYEYLGLKMVSYSVYDNPFEIIEIPVQNPISNYGRKLYTFKLIDTLQIENRKVYRIYFQPKKLKSSSLRGLLYIDAENYGVAQAFYKIYGMITINASYTFNYLKEHQLWFPEKRKFTVVKGNNNDDLKILGGTIKFNSTSKQRLQNDASDQTFIKIESKPFDIKINDKVTINQPSIKINVPKNSMNVSDNYWNTFRKDTLDIRKLKTYVALDSLSDAENIEQKIFLGKKIFNGYFPVNIIDVDLRSIVKYNNYEGFRLGLGGVTNTKLSEKYKIGFYGAYGFKDDKIKYGLTPSYLLQKETNTWVSATYINDVSEIGQIQFATENRRFKIYDPRPVNISTFYANKTISAFIESKYVPKTDTYFGISRTEIEPLFDYTFNTNGISYDKYKISMAQFSIQWNPFSSYMQTPTGRLEIEKRYPKFTFQFTKSLPNLFDNNFDFTKADFKIQHDIPYLTGHNTSFLFQAGIGTGEIPLTHLYSIAPNNLDKNTLLKRITFAGKNSFETMYYNEFFSSKYLMFQARHTFNKVKLAYKIDPVISVATRMAFGSVENPEQHDGFAFKTLEKGFFESGVEVNKIFKGFGLTCFYRYGPNGLPKFEDNIAVKISFNLDLGF